MISSVKKVTPDYPVAHTPNEAGHWHRLTDHLTTVASTSSTFAAKLGAQELGYWLGIWHDLGKFHPAFQRYLHDAAAGTRRRGPDHKAAGVAIALRHVESAAFPLAGHHGGLRDRAGELRPWINERVSTPEVAEALLLARSHLESIEPATALRPPPFINTPLAAELFVRMLFSALVDADFLDTERHFNPSTSAIRGAAPTLAELWNRLAEAQDQISGRRRDEVSLVRHEVYQQCLTAAEQPPGFFRLTVPTGGGKTRSGLAFALQHALLHGHERIIVAIPYTSITEQTASVYRELLGSERAVIEHHSAVERPESAEGTPEESWERLAAENWDGPLIVTTTVQLFESLLGARTGRCRKLHNVARSVIILDEVQTLPPPLLEPIMDVLRELVANYGVTVVLSTATQPALDERLGFPGLPGVRDIVAEPEQHFARLRRVRYHWLSQDGDWSWPDLAARIAEHPQSLTILNTRRDALAALDALDDPTALHLSTYLCGAHRRDVLAEIRQRLAEGAPCRVVATQVVEAGVDLDFPIVFRALAPLDRIIQAAGRCNREGLLTSGDVFVFEPADGSIPRGDYRTGTDLTRNLLAAQRLDPNDPNAAQAYFQGLYQRVSLDKHGIQPLRRGFNYSTVARRFRFIDDDTVPVAVRYRPRATGGAPDKQEGPHPIDPLIEQLSARRGSPRLVWRALQPYIINVRRRDAEQYAQQGLAGEIAPGLWLWLGAYDPICGIGLGRRSPEDFIA